MFNSTLKTLSHFNGVTEIGHNKLLQLKQRHVIEQTLRGLSQAIHQKKLIRGSEPTFQELPKLLKFVERYISTSPVISKSIGFGQSKVSETSISSWPLFKKKKPFGLQEFLNSRKDLSEEDPETKVKLSEAYIAGFQSHSSQNKGFSWISPLISISWMAVFVAIIYMMTKKGGLNLEFSIDRIDTPDVTQTSFKDVIGCDEVKKELENIVDFLKNPTKYAQIGAKLPKGILLSGPPGVGKTLIAKAVAGEAGVNFLHCSGSDFNDMFVGSGAARVRNLFNNAKMKSPCVIFIDEFDSVGSRRTNSTLHPYANQTINQLLSEMDGFLTNDGIIVIAATNAPENLDKAFLRPGRFDSHVRVGLPDVKGRHSLFEYYIMRINHSTDIDIDKLSKRSVNFSGADIKEIINKSAIIAILSGETKVRMEHMWKAFDKQLMGPSQTRYHDEEDNAVTAVHEAGHALLVYFNSAYRSLHKLTILRQGQALGHTSFIPKKDMRHSTREQLIQQLDICMGGLAAEELVFGKEKVTSGCSSDLTNATNIARSMVTDFGMSDTLGRVVINMKNASPSLKDSVDKEIKRLIDESYERTKQVLKANIKQLEIVSKTLLDQETLDGDEVESLIKTGKLPEKSKESDDSDKLKKKGGFKWPFDNWELSN